MSYPTQPLRVLVALNDLRLGGSQLNALDLAVSLANRGHHVVAYATHEGPPGPVAKLAEERGLPLILSPRKTTGRASLVNARRILRLVHQEQIDIVHAYEFPVAFDCYYGPHLWESVALVVTIYSMSVSTWLPRTIPLIVGTRELATGATPYREAPTVLLEPPVDTDADSPDSVDGRVWRAEQGLGPDHLAIVIVSRLAWDLKAEGIERSIRAIPLLHDRRVRLVIVGTGDALDHLREVAAEANEALGYEAVRMAGPAADPRPAYAGADVVLGMGHSALRALSFGKSLVVLGEEGFSLPFAPDTARYFLEAGFYGLGPGDRDPRALAEQIRPLLDDPRLRAGRGAYGRELVVERFSLRAATDHLDRLYRDAVATPVPVGRRVREAAWMSCYRLGAQLIPDGAKDRLRSTVHALVRRPRPLSTER